MNFSEVGKLSVLKHTLTASILLVLILGLTACFEIKDDAATVATPKPTGAIHGKLIDSVTQQPIVGAIVDIGAATATTNTDGQFAISNIEIPVDAANSIKTTVYKVTIDMRGVISPLNMSDATSTPRYPDFYYDLISILFSSASSSATTTPVTYLIENIDFKVGKLAANIVGVVADKNTLLPVAAGYTVKLVALGSPATTTTNGGTGTSESIVGSTLTDVNGSFTFANIEALGNFRIDSWNLQQTFRGSQNVIAPVEGVTKTLSVQTNDAVLVASTDTLSPTIISVTPQMNADIAPAPVDVVFTFSEPILQTPNTSTSSSVSTGLYNKVDVKFMGAKASNISHSLSWNSTFTQLTITIPSLAASSNYTVDLTPADALLVDLNGNSLSNTIDKRVLNFTTNGSTTASAPTLVTVANSSSLNYNSPTVLLNWLPVSGAKAYNVYRAQNYPSAAGQLQLMGTNPSTLTSDYSDTLPVAYFVSGQNKLTYTYVVTSVSADNIESAGSASVTAQDTVAPTATIPTGLAATYTITYSEPVDEASATTLARYIFAQGSAASVPTVVSAVLNAGLTTVTLTLNASTTIGNVLAITGVQDVAGNVMTSAIRTF